MAYVQRLILALCCLLGVNAVHASFPVPVGYRHTYSATVYPTPAAACAAVTAYLTSQSTTHNYTLDGTRLSGSSYLCDLRSKPKDHPEYTGSTQTSTLTATTGSCPANSTSASGQCTCTSPYVQNSANNACEMPNPCAALAGKDAGDVTWNGGPVSASPIRPDYTYCDGWQELGQGKCTATARRDVSFGVDGKWINTGRAVYTGSLASGQCNGDGGTGDAPTESVKPPGDNPLPPETPPEGQAAPAPCPQGQAPGEVNGTRVCAGRGPETPVQANDSKEIKNPDGSSTTTNGTTTCKDGKCTRDETTCTKSSPSATPACTTGTSTTTSQGTFCEANKGSKVCEGSDGDGSFSGNCAAGFKAESEDPVVAAMALEQHKRNCELFVNTTPESELYNVEKVKTGNQTGNLPGNADVAIGSSSFDSSDALGGGACWSDKHFTIKGYDFNMKLSSICPYASQLGNLLVAIAFLTAAGIVYRGSNT